MYVTHFGLSKLFERPEHQIESTVTVLFANTALIPTFHLRARTN